MISDLNKGINLHIFLYLILKTCAKTIDVDIARREIDNGGVPKKKCRVPPLTKAHSHGMYFNNLE